MFFSWMVSSSAVARDFRSEMDCGVTGKLQPFSSDCNNSFTARVKTKISGRVRTCAPASSKQTLFGGENSRQRAAVGLREGFRVLPTLQGTLKSQERESEHHRRQNTCYANSCCSCLQRTKCATTLYLTIFDFSRRISSWSWLSCWCKYLEDQKHQR